MVCGLAACAPAGRPWAATLVWGRDVAVGWQDGSATGPLAAAVGPRYVVVADSFGGRLLFWRRQRGQWVGPEARELPGGGPVTGVALYPVDGPDVALAADGAGRIWAVPAAGPARLLVQLRSSPGDLTRAVALAVAPDGTPVIEVVEVTVQRSSRTVYAVEAGGRLRPLLSAEVARAGPVGAGNGGMWLSPVGVRATLAPAREGGVWLAVRGVGGTQNRLVRLGAGGSVAERRPLPAELPRPVDFLGVDGEGLAYALVGGGGPNPRIVVFDRAGRTRRTYRLPPAGTGPRLPHPAALSPDGSLLTLTADGGGLHVRWWPAGRGPSPVRPRR
jgi:hypothetical protein